MQATVPNVVATDSVPAPRTIAFDEIHARVTAHHAAEAIRNAPKAVAVRAVYTLGSALADLDAEARARVLTLLKEEILALPVSA